MAVEITWDQFAACSTVGGVNWGLIERSVEECMTQYEGRTKRRRAYQQALPALLICQQCPVKPQCLAWGRECNYSGIAGGLVLINGRILTPPDVKGNS